jgi:hypothetical protein
MATDTFGAFGGKQQVGAQDQPTASPKPVEAAMLPTPELIPVEAPAAKLEAKPVTVKPDDPEWAANIKKVLETFTEQAAVQIEEAGARLVMIAESRRQSYNLIAENIRHQGKTEASRLSEFVVDVQESADTVTKLQDKFDRKG